MKEQREEMKQGSKGRDSRFFFYMSAVIEI